MQIPRKGTSYWHGLRIVCWSRSTCLVQSSIRDGSCELGLYSSWIKSIYSQRHWDGADWVITSENTQAQTSQSQRLNSFFGDSQLKIGQIWQYILSKDLHLISSLQAVVTWRANNWIYSLTQATDTRNIQHVFDVVCQTLLQNALKDTGIIL